jgi:hypothetical protein
MAAVIEEKGRNIYEKNICELVYKPKKSNTKDDDNDDDDNNNNNLGLPINASTWFLY